MSRFAVDWSELSLQVMMTFGHFLWQAFFVAIVLIIVEQLSSIVSRAVDSRTIVSGRAQALRSKAVNQLASNLPAPDGLRRSATKARYSVACLAFFSLPICVAVTFAWVHQSRGSFFLTAKDPIVSPAIASAIEYPSNPPLASNSVPMSTSADMLAEPPLPSEVRIPAAEPIDKPDFAISSTTWAERAQSIAPYLLIAYAIGAGLMLTRFGLSIIGSSRLRQKLQAVTDSNLLKIIAEQASRLGLKRVPIVALCQRVSVPVVVGIVKPMILLPPALACGLDPNQLAAILSHEMAHIRRYDLIVNLLQRIVEALLFFHPVTWWISRRVSIERENCCDDVAAACTGRLPYASALLQMAELIVRNDRPRLAALASLSVDGGNSSDFGSRIRRLIDAEETTRIGVTRRGLAVGLAMVSLLTVSLVTWGQSRQTADEKSEDESMSKIFTPEPLWQMKIAADEVCPDMSRISPVVIATDRVLTIGKDFDRRTGEQIENAFERLPRKNEMGMALDPVLRRKSSDRAFLLEVSRRTPPATTADAATVFTRPSFDLRVLRASDCKQVGKTIMLPGLFDVHTSDVDVENSGNFLLLGMANEVRVYRTETGQVETTMPVKSKRVDAVAFCPDRDWLVVSDQNDLHFWRWRDQAPVKTIHAGRKIDSLVFTPDGQYLAEGPDTREDIQIRDMRTLEIVASLKDEVGSPLMVSSMDITPNGRFLVAHNEVSVDQSKLTIPHRVHVWDLRTRGKPVFQIATGEWVRSVAFSDDGQMIVGEFSGAAHGSLLAAWNLPDEVIDRKVDSPRDAKDRLGDGIQWSTWGDKDGLLSGARLILPEGGLRPGQPLVVEYRLANVSTETKSLKCYLNKGMQYTSLGRGNSISGSGLEWHRVPVTLTIEPGDVFIDTEHLVSIDTKGLEPGEYQAALGSAFRYPDDAEPNTTHEIPHRGRIPFAILGESTLRISEMPKSDIHWGKPINGLQLGGKFTGDPTAFAIGTTIEADLFVANVTDQPIECSVAVPHISEGWHFNVVDSNGNTMKLDGPLLPIHSPYVERRIIPLNLAAGEIVPLTIDGHPLRSRPAFATSSTKLSSTSWLSGADLADLTSWSNRSINSSLVTQGGAYTATFGVTLMRPEIPALRLELDSGNVPFTVVGKELKQVVGFDPTKFAPTTEVEIRYPHCIVEKNRSERSLIDAIVQFNQSSLDSPIGAWQPPITEQETRDAIEKSIGEPNVEEPVRRQLREILKSGILQSNVYFRRFTRLDDKRQMHEVWWVRLVVETQGGPVYSVVVRTTAMKSRPYTQMERQQNAGSLMLINRFVSYFDEPPNILLLREFPKDAVDSLVKSADASIKAKDVKLYLSLFDWNGVSDSTRDFVKTEFEVLTGSTIHSIKVAPRNFRGELIHWSAYQHYQPNLEIVGYLDIEYTSAEQRRKKLSFEMGQSGDGLRLVNYVPKGAQTFPEGRVEGLSMRGHLEKLSDGSYLETTIVTNPGTLLSGHIANEEVRQRDLPEQPLETPPAIPLEERLHVETLLNSHDQEVTPNDILWGEPVDGLRLGLRLSKFAKRRSPLRHGEHVEYEVWIKNETDEVVRIGRDPRDLVSPRLMEDQSINIIGSSMFLSFDVPQEELIKAELILPPGQAAKRFPNGSHRASIRPPGSPRGRYGSEPLHIEPGHYPVYAQLGKLKSGVEQLETLPASRLQIRRANEVTENRRKVAAEDPSEEILSWQTSDGAKREAMVNWDGGVLVDEADLASIEVVQIDGQPERYSIQLQLRPEAASWFARMTKMLSEMQEKNLLVILLDGKPLVAPRLDAPIPHGKIMIAGSFTKKEADKIASRLRSWKNANWITAPQLCVGKAYSDTAKAANWTWDKEQRASLATPESGEMLTSCLPGVDADFVVQVSLRLVDGAQCRLTVGNATFDVTGSADRIQLSTAGKKYAFDNNDKSREWTLLKVTRRDNKMSIQVNEQPAIDLGVNAQAIKKISLRSTVGMIAVSNFVVTGNVQRVNNAQVVPQNAGLQIQALPNTGILTGRIVIEGVLEPLPKLRVPTPSSPRLSKRTTDEAREKYKASLVEIEDEALLVDAEQGLANAFVYLAKAPTNWQPTQTDAKPISVTMRDFGFEPRAAVVRTGQNVRLDNLGAAPDNFGFEPLMNVGQNRLVNAGSEITLEKPFTSSERIPIQAKSQINPWKTTFLLPLDHPFGAITDKQGRFSIEGLPPGVHTYLVWHERTGWLEKSLLINILAGQTTDVERSYNVDRFRRPKAEGQAKPERKAEAEDASTVSFQIINQQARQNTSKVQPSQAPVILGQWDVSPTPNKTGVVPQAESMTLKFSEQGKFESYVQKQNYVEFASGSWKLDGSKVSVKFRPFAMQPRDNADVEATMQFDTPDALILDGTRFLKRSAATPVALAANHPLHSIAKDVLAKLNASAPRVGAANNVLPMPSASSPNEIWQFVQLRDKPSLTATKLVDPFDASKSSGYRLVFARDYHESANTMQQAVQAPSEIPFRVRTEQFEMVLFANVPAQPPLELRSHIAWIPTQSRWPTHDICLGDGLGYRWFVRAPILICHALKSELRLSGGDDMIASLIQATISKKNFPHATDAYTASAMLSSYGDLAVNAVEQAVRQKKPQEDLWHTIRSLAEIRTESSSRLLVRLYQSEDTDIRSAAAYALNHKPYRREASQVYLDMLKNRMSVEAASAACIELGLKDAIPILKELFSNTFKPSSLGELNTIFVARRELEGNPIPQELLDASQTIFMSSAANPTDEGSAVGKAIKQFKDSKDHEAVVMLALQMVGYTSKSNVNHICVHGATILGQQKQGSAPAFLQGILDSLPERERLEIVQRIAPNR